MDLDEIRKWIIIAMFSDDVLFERLVLKGGNALHIVHKVGSRSSLDVDFSIPEDFEDIDDTRARIFATLRDRFESINFVVFDEKLSKNPPAAEGKWGGYTVEFKLITVKLYKELEGNVEAIRKQSEISGPRQQRIFRIQISKYEYCEPKAPADLEGYTIYVYTPPMIVAEKLRAICQQMDNYPHRVHKTPRGRDFYDIHESIKASKTDMTTNENCDLIENIFAAKEVPLSLLGHIEEYREFHRQDWPSVVDSVAGTIEAFDFFFAYVLELVRSLESLWEE